MYRKFIKEQVGHDEEMARRIEDAAKNFFFNASPCHATHRAVKEFIVREAAYLKSNLSAAA